MVQRVSQRDGCARDRGPGARVGHEDGGGRAEQVRVHCQVAEDEHRGAHAVGWQQRIDPRRTREVEARGRPQHTDVEQPRLSRLAAHRVGDRHVRRAFPVARRGERVREAQRIPRHRPPRRRARCRWRRTVEQPAHAQAHRAQLDAFRVDVPHRQRIARAPRALHEADVEQARLGRAVGHTDRPAAGTDQRAAEVITQARVCVDADQVAGLRRRGEHPAGARAEGRRRHRGLVAARLHAKRERCHSLRAHGEPHVHRARDGTGTVAARCQRVEPERRCRAHAIAFGRNDERGGVGRVRMVRDARARIRHFEHPTAVAWQRHVGAVGEHARERVESTRAVHLALEGVLRPHVTAWKPLRDERVAMQRGHAAGAAVEVYRHRVRPARAVHRPTHHELDEALRIDERLAGVMQVGKQLTTRDG